MQVELVKTGKPYVMFGDGQLASCKPISEADLASFMADCIKDPAKANQVLPIGGKLIFSLTQKTDQTSCLQQTYYVQPKDRACRPSLNNPLSTHAGVTKS